MWQMIRQFLNTKQYLYYIGRHDILPPPLKGQQEKEIIEKAVSGDQKARDLLIEHNLRLVVYVAKRYDNSANCPLEDLISIGTIGLVKAINTFKADKNIKLATYASRCIENEILMYLRKNNKIRYEISLDEPLNIDYDGNELLLGDIVGTDDDLVEQEMLKSDQKKIFYEALKELNEIRVLYLGKKGPIQEAMKSMKNMDPDQRKTFGQTSNKVKQELSKAVEDKKEVLEHQAIIDKINSETIDLSLPSYKLDQGTMHPLSIIVSQLEELFLGMGYQIAEGPEVESDYFNFELMNLPKGHPARDMQDTFYIDENTLMRTHTSPVQAHTLLAAKGKGPIKVICPGKTYRRDDDDATHSHQFMQCEGLVVDKNITLADLKGTLEVFARKFFGEKREIRLRPSYFPFTEPSVEVDISCHHCGGKGCAMCKGTGWIEILGAGMVNPKVLDMCGFDSKVYQGFAFGIGIERVAMLKYGIDNIRDFYNDDLRFLNQFQREE